MVIHLIVNKLLFPMDRLNSALWENRFEPVNDVTRGFFKVVI